MVQTRRMSPKIGVQVSRVDIRKIEDASFAPICQAWLDHNVMAVAGQDPTIDDFLAYTRRRNH